MFGTLLQFLLLTATRRDEARCMVERELNLRSGEWTLPGDRTKNKLEFVVPMAPAAVELLKTLKRTKGKAGLIFTQDGEVAISALSKRKARVEKAMLDIARKEAAKRGDDPDAVKIPNWRIHDLRRTARTRLARLRVAEIVIERCLNHVEQSGVKATYNRYQYLKEKREAFAELADHIKAVVDDMPANVIDLDTRRGAA
jgi:integrase